MPARVLIRKHFYEDLARDVVGFLHGRRRDVMEPVWPLRRTSEVGG